MIDDLENKVKSSKKFQNAVSDYLMKRDDSYMTSRCRKRMEKRYKWLKASLDGAYSPNNSDGYAVNGWLPSLIFPVVREMYYMGRAMTMKNFRQEPLITLEPEYDTPYENSLNAQIALNTNFKRTNFRSKCFSPIVDDVWRCGFAVTYSGIVRNEKNVLKTVDTPFGPMQQNVSRGTRTNVVNTRIHPLDYAQDDMVADPEESSWRRIFESISVATLIAQYKKNPDIFIRENIEEIIKVSKSEVWQDDNKYRYDETIMPDLGRHNVDIKRYFAKVWISGNEDDDTDYEISMIKDKIISFDINRNDESICPVQVYRLRRRPQYFWGNSPAEDNLGHEKFLHILMNMTAQNALQALERYVFYDKNAFDMSSVLNARSNGGFIPIEMRSNLQIQNMIHEYQGRDASMQNIDWVAREVKESVQKAGFKPDFLRSGNKGGLANDTATAANILDETSNTLESDCMETFGYDICGIGKINTILLQMFLGDFIKLQLDPKQGPITIMKSQLLGDNQYNVISTLNKNTIQQAIKLQNVLTQILNYKGSGDPTWQNVNIVPIAKKWIQQLDVGDPDAILPQQMSGMNPMQAPNQLQSTPPQMTTSPEEMYA